MTMNANVRTFLPFDTDDLAVHALDDGKVAIRIGRAIVHLKPGEAAALSDSLSRAAIAAGHQHYVVNGVSGRVPIVTDAMVDRAVEAWEAWWKQDGMLSSNTTMRDGLNYVLRKVLGGAA